MADSPEPLILDLVAWVAVTPRPYAEVLEAWRTSCPRLTVWEDAVAERLVACEPAPAGVVVVATEDGRRRLAGAGRAV